MEEKSGKVDNFQKATKCGVVLPIAKFANLNTWRIPWSFYKKSMKKLDVMAMVNEEGDGFYNVIGWRRMYTFPKEDNWVKDKTQDIIRPSTSTTFVANYYIPIIVIVTEWRTRHKTLLDHWLQWHLLQFVLNQ